MVYSSDEQISAVLENFETCRTGKGDFHHEHHLVVAACYLQSLSIQDATRKLRQSLHRFLKHHQVDAQKYNETLTMFWLEMVARELSQIPQQTALVSKCNSVIAALSDPKLVSEFYSDELLWSESARQAFVEPDKKHWK